ncbi:adenylate cyclase CyaB-like [Montipora capricornis]|uniref:adenylate cyclase CyaB-like n=1 Tax=Montipora capricornis TaxID=246305 RepID=UPI0035F12DCF
MPSNMEIKVKVDDLEKLTRKVEELSASEGEIIEQSDVFFNVPQGRLKLRYLQNRPSQLIFYERDDKSGPKMSNFHIATTNNPDDLANVLSHALGQKGIVKKRRLLYLVGQTRVHCDDVEGLGHFMELEVVMKENQSATEGEAIAKDLMSKLGLKDADLVKGAYIDLLSSQNA